MIPVLFMKTIFLLLTVLFLPGALAPAEQCWTYGVTQEHGWYDADKQRGTDSPNDLEQCWAMSCSNIINWWQDHIPSGILTSNGIPNDSTPEGQNVASTFRNSFTDQSNWQENGFSWWLSGNAAVAPDTNLISQPYFREGASEAGYYKQLLTSDQYTFNGANSLITRWSDYRIQSPYIVNTITSALQNGYGLSMTIQTGASSHALTLWGIEYEGNTLTKIFYTDSDDARRKFSGSQKDEAVLKTATIESNNNMIQLKGCKAYSENGAITSIPNSEDVTYDSYYLMALHGLRLADSIPEPSAASLGMFGLMALLAFRKRKR